MWYAFAFTGRCVFAMFNKRGGQRWRCPHARWLNGRLRQWHSRGSCPSCAGRRHRRWRSIAPSPRQTVGRLAQTRAVSVLHRRCLMPSSSILKCAHCSAGATRHRPIADEEQRAKGHIWWPLGQCAARATH